MHSFSFNAALDKIVYRKFVLASKREISPNTIIFRFDLPSATARFGLPVGKHCLLRFEDAEGKQISRPYTPVSSEDNRGFFEILMKVYESIPA